MNSSEYQTQTKEHPKIRVLWIVGKDARVWTPQVRQYTKDRADPQGVLQDFARDLSQGMWRSPSCEAPHLPAGLEYLRELFHEKPLLSA